MAGRGALLRLTLADVAGGVFAESAGGRDASAAPPSYAAPSAAAAVTEAPCSSGGPGTTRVSPARDVVLGPLVLIGGRRWARIEPNAFNRQGYKVPVTLPKGVQATLTVPAAMRGRLGLVFSPAAQDPAATMVVGVARRG